MKLGKNTLMFNHSVEQNIFPFALGTTPRVLLSSANDLGQYNVIELFQALRGNIMVHKFSDPK